MSGYFRLEVKNINRSTRNIIACASYRSDEKLYSERTNEYIEFRNHIEKPDSMILTPEHAPEWTKDREKLWNEVDKKERSVQENSRVAREIILSLPNNFDHNINRELTKNFVNDEFVSKGMIADVSIHTDDSNNPHAHVLLTTRPILENGEWGSKRKTEYVYDDEGNHVLTSAGNKKRRSLYSFEFNQEYIKDIRKKYENILNKYSERSNEKVIYSSKSYEEQGKDQIPLKRLTREEYYLENKEKLRCEKHGIEYKPITFYGKVNQKIEEYNKGLSQDIDNDLNNKVIDINDKIRNYVPSVSIDKDKLKLVSKRNKGYVDYKSAKKIFKDLHPKTSSYGRMINHEKEKLKFKKDYLISLYEVYENNPKDIVKYGYSVKNFVDEAQSDINKLKEEVQSFNHKEAKYNELYAASKDVYRYFESSNRELYEELFKDENKEYFNHSSDQIYAYLEKTKKGNYVDITEISGLDTSENDINNIKNFDMYTKLAKEIYFANKDIQRDTLELKDGLDKDTIFNLSYRVNEYNNKVSELKEFEKHIDDDLINTIKTFEISYEELDEISAYNKVKMLETLHDDNNKFNDKEVFEHHKNNDDIDHELVDNYENVSSRNSMVDMSNSLFNSLNSAINDVETKSKYKDLYNKHKKLKNKYKEFER